MENDDRKPPPASDNALVDRDDDVDSGAVDSDYADDFPGPGPDADDEIQSSPPDPGYAAFADELDDPLADWPAPETPLEELPEIRAQAAPDQNLQPDAFTRDAPAGPPFVEDPFAEDPFAKDPFAEDPIEDMPFAAEPYTPYDTPAATELTRSSVEASVEQAPFPGVPERSIEANIGDLAAPAMEATDDPGLFDTDTDADADDEGAEPATVDNDAALPAFTDPAPFPEPPTESELFGDPLSGSAVEDLVPPPPPADPIDDEFVDDFLNDLDLPQVDSGDSPRPGAQVLDPFDDEPDTAAVAAADELFPEDRADLSPAVPAAIAAFASDRSDELANDLSDDLPDDLPGDDDRGAKGVSTAADTVFAGEPDDSVERSAAAAGSGGRAGGKSGKKSRGTPPGGGNGDRRIPVATIAVLILALGLLAAGGYGVLQERGELQAEIRDLRAQLATTITPDEAVQEREQQRQAELQNETLNAELDALSAENRELADRLRAMEQTLATREEESAAQLAAVRAEARADAEREASREARIAQQAERNRTPTPVSTDSESASAAPGTWFVNFGSYAQRDAADRWAARLNVDAGRVGVMTASASGKTLYRVRILDLADRDEAERVATRLEREFQLPRLWVGRAD